MKIDESSVTVEFVEAYTSFGCCGDSDEENPASWKISGQGRLKRKGVIKFRPIERIIFVEELGSLEVFLTEVFTASEIVGTVTDTGERASILLPDDEMFE